MDAKVSVIIPVYNNDRFLKDTLKSVKNQTLKELEIIIVNDGSTDDSERIIDDFIKEDARAVKLVQENKGVSQARNNGLENATAEYVGFVDGDDTVPAYYYEKLYNTAAKNNADIVVGIMNRIGTLSDQVNKRTQKLAAKKEIKKDDTDMIHSFSVCNKIFSRDMIQLNQLRFEDTGYAEDAVFVYNALQYARKICGCKVMYNYHRRLQYITVSATQTVTKAKLDNTLKVFDRLFDITSEWSDEFKRELTIRLFKTTLITGYYRRLWQMDDKTFDLLVQKLDDMANNIDQEDIRKTYKQHNDLELEKGFRDKSRIAEEPLITVILSEGVSKKHINILLQTLYSQDTPNFQVIVWDGFKGNVEDLYTDMQNFTFEKGGDKDYRDVAIKRAKGRFFVYVDTDIIFNYDTLKGMYKAMVKNDDDKVSVMMVHPSKDTREKLVTAQLSYDKKCPELDPFEANKMYRMSSFVTGAEKDIRFERKKTPVMGFMGTDEDILKASKNVPGHVRGECKKRIRRKKIKYKLDKLLRRV